jgi:hypothetical protein
LKRLIKTSLLFFAYFFILACSAEERELPGRQLFEEHFLKGLQLGSSESLFKETFESAICRQSPPVKSPYSHWSHSKCMLDPMKRDTISISIPGSGPVTVVQYEAEFFYERLESTVFQFLKKDFSRVYQDFKTVLGKPTRESSKRIAGQLGPTLFRNKITIWKQPDYSIKLQSRPGGGSISLLQFYTSTYPLRLKEPFEKQLKESSDVSTYNLQHYEDIIKKIDSNY